MGINFPTPTAVGEMFEPQFGPSYMWNGAEWKRADLTALPRNRVVNPQMLISQENGSTAAPYTTTGGAYHMADQWPGGWSATVPLRICSYAAGPSGAQSIYFQASPGVAVINASDYAIIWQYIEGNRVADLAWGTAYAKPAVLRFQCTCSVAGTYSIAVMNGAEDQSFVASFVQPQDIWATHIIPIPARTTGTWGKDTSIGVRICFTCVLGPTYQGVAGWQTGAKFGITGMSNGLSQDNGAFHIADVGFYVDPLGTGVPPPSEMQDIDQTLRECQRYYELVPATVIGNTYAPWPYFGWGYKVNKRISPALSIKAGNTGSATLYSMAHAPTWGCRHVASTSGYFDILIAANARF